MGIDAYSTREEIKTKFLEYSEKVNYSQISVAELCRELGINRATFYYYYQSIDGLLNELEYEFLSKVAFAECFSGTSYIYEKVLRHAIFVKNNRSIFFTLLANGKLISEFQKIGLEQGEVFSQRRLTDYQSGSLRLLSAYTIAGHIELLKAWLTSCPDVPPEKIATIICEMAFTAAQLHKKTK